MVNIYAICAINFLSLGSESLMQQKLSIMMGIMEPIWENSAPSSHFCSYICILWNSLFDSLQLATKEIYLHF